MKREASCLSFVFRYTADMSKHEQLDDLRERMLAADLPLATNLVFGEGNPDAAVMFIGEAPGAQEDATGRPFVGRGGQFLEAQLGLLGWKREDVYITSVLKKRPPNNRDPLPDEVRAYAPYLTEQIAIINPRLIVPLGRFAMHYFVPDGKIIRDQGSPFVVGGRSVVPMLHPAAALRGNAMRALFEASFAKLPEYLASARPSES